MNISIICVLHMVFMILRWCAIKSLPPGVVQMHSCNAMKEVKKDQDLDRHFESCAVFQ